MTKIESGDRLYLCDRKQCGSRCSYPDCRHTTDISHAVNGDIFPNGFEKIEHKDKVYFVEKEHPTMTINEFVYFGKYCKTCKHEKLEENEPPCDECLERPINLNSHKPVNYENKND